MSNTKQASFDASFSERQQTGGSTRRWLTVACISFNILVFVVAVWAKINNTETLYRAIDKAVLLPPHLINSLVWGVIMAEAGIVVGLLMRHLRRISLIFSIILSGIFLLYSIWRIFSGIDASCGCFGDLFVLSPVQSVLLNVVMLVSQLFALYQYPGAVNYRSSESSRPTLRAVPLVDAAIITVTVTVTLHFLMATFNSWRQLHSVGAPSIVQTTVAPERLRDNAVSMPYTLIEFGDYQCEYCRSSHSYIQSLRSRHADKLGFVYFQYPLNKIHPLAQQAAEVSVAARQSGNFDTVHRQLMERDLDHNALTELQRMYSSDEKQERGIIERDIRLGRELGIRKTPTFFLMDPQGKLYAINSPAEADSFLEKLQK